VALDLEKTTNEAPTAPLRPGTPQAVYTMREAVKIACKPQTHRIAQVPTSSACSF